MLYVYDTTLPASTKKVTVIEIINVSEQDTSPPRRLYTHTETIDVVSASVNSTQRLLAFSTVAHFQSVSEHTRLQTTYDSYVVDISDPKDPKKSSPRVCGGPSSTFQRVQFLSGDASAVGRPSHLLVFRHQHGIDLHTLGPTCTQRNIHNNFLWFQYDLHRKALYLLCSSGSALASGAETRFKCITFARNEPETKIDVLLPIEAIHSRFSTVTGFTYVVRSGSRTVLANGFNMQVVHMSGNGLCVCVQHAPPRDYDRTRGDLGGSITFTVFALHRCCALEYTLDLPRAPTQDINGSMLYFAAVSNLLVVYVPGLVLQLLDICVDHEPCHHLGFVDGSVPVLPHQSPPGARAALTHFELARQHTSNKLIGPALFDARTGAAYHISIDHSFLLSLITSTQKTTTKIIALHLALVHLDQKNFFQHLCHHNPDALDVPFLKEYLIASVYMYLLQHMSQREKDLIRLLPVTTIPNFYDELAGLADSSEYANHCEWATRRFFLLPREHIVDGLAGPQNKKLHGTPYDSLTLLPPHIETPRFNFDHFEEWVDVKPTYATPVTRSASSMISRLFFKPKAAAVPPIAAKSGDPMKALQAQMLTSFRDHLRRWAPESLRERCSEWEESYRNQQNTVSQTMIETIKSLPTQPQDPQGSAAAMPFPGSLEPDETSERTLVLFRLFQRLQCAAQDLCFPLSLDFGSSFLHCAYQSLPRPLFAQYVASGALNPTFDFVCRVVEDANMSGRAEDHAFAMHLVSLLDAASVTKLFVAWRHPEIKRRLAQAAVEGMIPPEPRTPAHIARVEDEFLVLHTLRKLLAGRPTPEHLQNFVTPNDIEEVALHSTTLTVADPREALDWDI